MLPLPPPPSPCPTLLLCARAHREKRERKGEQKKGEKHIAGRPASTVPSERDLWTSRVSGVLKSREMARVPLGLMAVVVLVFGIALMPAVRAQSTAPAPAPTSDGVSIDQGIAYALMLVALVLTYLIHPLDASSPCKLF